ncbi:MAG: magnesium transporter [Alphaproteobacteria bacterium]|nr:magnesium transporter [Alphaproteobacteria bacterium]MBU0799317.1 magnesium transporter [Alphaproteobacteria bacterium]MBU0888169.1 magnesium transporter [Alphaproteobacteria bacterium]MBU1811614.1 magnesium transporter [Alphaproteobacteria bacterium]MBU2090748.1 magnesium transporter [Alphaproteobacteria bacterium]
MSDTDQKRDSEETGAQEALPAESSSHQDHQPDHRPDHGDDMDGPSTLSPAATDAALEAEEALEALAREQGVPEPAEPPMPSGGDPAAPEDAAPAQMPSEMLKRFALTPKLERRVAKAIDEDKLKKAAKLAHRLHAADLADLIERLSYEQRALLLEGLRDRFDAEILPYLNETVRDEVIDLLGPETVGKAISELDSDDAIAIIEDMEEGEKEAILATVDPADRALLEEGLTFPEESAGRLMQRELVAVPSHWTVGQTIDFMRTNPNLPDDFYEIFVVDPRFKPVGVLSLGRLLHHKRPVRLRDIMATDFVRLQADTPQAEVAHLFRQYGLVSAPVVNDSGRLLGRVTVDDVVDIVDEEAEEDILRLGGVSESDLQSSVFDTVKQRFMWLLINLGTAIMASGVIAMFEGTIEQIVALAVLMPIVASMGGNAGTQTVTVVVRALAMRNLSTSNALRVIWKETAVGLLNGTIFAVLIGLIAGFWFDPIIGGVIGAAMIINMLVAGLSGALIPIGLERLKIDPAVASSVFLTTMTDVIGFFAFLGLARAFLL